MPDTNINNMHDKEDYIEALKMERFREYVAQREADALLWWRGLAVFLACAFICAAATLALSYNG